MALRRLLKLALRVDRLCIVGRVEAIVVLGQLLRGGRLRLICILLVLLMPVETMLDGSGCCSCFCGGRLVVLLGEGARSKSNYHRLLVLLAGARWSGRCRLMDQLLVVLLAFD